MSAIALTPAAAHIGELIAAERVRRGLTQGDLAQLTRIDSSNIRGYEKGRALMGIPTLVRIAEALKIDPGNIGEASFVSLRSLRNRE